VWQPPYVRSCGSLAAPRRSSLAALSSLSAQRQPGGASAPAHLPLFFAHSFCLRAAVYIGRGWHQPVVSLLRYLWKRSRHGGAHAAELLATRNEVEVFWFVTILTEMRMQPCSRKIRTAPASYTTTGWFKFFFVGRYLKLPVVIAT
jgi:hypothetical protein